MYVITVEDENGVDIVEVTNDTDHAANYACDGYTVRDSITFSDVTHTLVTHTVRPVMEPLSRFTN